MKRFLNPIPPATPSPLPKEPKNGSDDESLMPEGGGPENFPRKKELAEQKRKQQRLFSAIVKGKNASADKLVLKLTHPLRPPHCTSTAVMMRRGSGHAQSMQQAAAAATAATAAAGWRPLPRPLPALRPPPLPPALPPRLPDASGSATLRVRSPLGFDRWFV